MCDVSYENAYEEGYNSGYDAGVLNAAANSLCPPVCLICGELLQKELFIGDDVIKCVSCRREYKLVEKE